MSEVVHTAGPKHPATFSRNILAMLDTLIPAGTFLDPFAGTGKIHRLTRDDRAFVGVELEPEWAEMEPNTICADSLQWMDESSHWGVFDGIVTSPVYGNRMSDHHDAKDGSRRRSYKFDLGRDLSAGSSAAMYFWSAEYKEFHRTAWRRALWCTRPGGLMLLNVKNFYRTVKKVQEPQHVVAWHMTTLREMGWTIKKVHQVKTPSMKHGENHAARFDGEAIIEAVKP